MENLIKKTEKFLRSYNLTVLQSRLVRWSVRLLEPKLELCGLTVVILLAISMMSATCNKKSNDDNNEKPTPGDVIKPSELISLNDAIRIVKDNLTVHGKLDDGAVTDEGVIKYQLLTTYSTPDVLLPKSLSIMVRCYRQTNFLDMLRSAHETNESLIKVEIGADWSRMSGGDTGLATMLIFHDIFYIEINVLDWTPYNSSEKEQRIAEMERQCKEASICAVENLKKLRIKN